LFDYEAALVSSPSCGLLSLGRDVSPIELPLNRLFALSDPPLGVGANGSRQQSWVRMEGRGAIFVTTCSGRWPACSSTNNARFLAPISGAHRRVVRDETSLLGFLLPALERSAGQTDALGRLFGCGS
jgi:hypothetical protein